MEIRNLDSNTRREIHKIENILHKRINAKSAKIFNTNCLREKLCPKSIKKSGTTQRTWTGVEKILRQRITESERKEKEINDEYERKWIVFSQEHGEDTIRKASEYIDHEARRYENIIQARHNKKLWNLNRGPVRNEEIKDGYINLSKATLTKNQKTLLNYGLKCHYIKRPKPGAKRMETEVLIDKLLQLQEENVVTLSPTVVDELVGESGRQRGSFRSNILTKDLKEAAEQLRNNKDIIVRRGDKAAIYVIMDTEEYDEKMDRIFGDTNKFQKLQKDPTDRLKVKINTLVKKANSVQQEIKFPQVIGDYGPGYSYGTVKTHKTGNPLRPIISQMTSPTYKVAKLLNQILVPYIPTGYAVAFPTDFIDLLKATNTNEDIASLDAESLFTNVPVDETIEIILDRVYRSNLDPLPIPEDILRKMLCAYTKETPFKYIEEHYLPSRDRSITS